MADRDASGRFVRGNPGGPGNPHAGTVARLRSVLLDTVTEDDLRAVVRALVDEARSGNVPAIRELLDRTLGRTPIAPPNGENGDGPAFVRVELESQRPLCGACHSPQFVW